MRRKAGSRLKMEEIKPRRRTKRSRAKLPAVLPSQSCPGLWASPNPTTRPFQTVRRSRVTMVINRAISRHELVVDPELASDLLVVPLYWRPILTGVVVDRAYVHRLAIALTAALKASAADKRKTREHRGPESNFLVIFSNCKNVAPIANTAGLLRAQCQKTLSSAAHRCRLIQAENGFDCDQRPLRLQAPTPGGTSNAQRARRTCQLNGTRCPRGSCC